MSGQVEEDWEVELTDSQKELMNKLVNYQFVAVPNGEHGYIVAFCPTCNTGLMLASDMKGDQSTFGVADWVEYVLKHNKEEHEVD